MENTNVNLLIAQFKEEIPQDKILVLKRALEKAPDTAYDVLNCTPIKNHLTTLLLSIFTGGLGIDRFYIGDTGVGVAKLLLGWLTCGIWPLVDVFVCYKRCKEKNLNTLLSALGAIKITRK